MSLSKSETKETISTLRDRLKHGQNMVKILENQLDDAQQNISLLQGQVRLANETIPNLKKYFSDTEKKLNEILFSPSHEQSDIFKFDHADQKDNADKETPTTKKHSGVENTSRSPMTADPNKSHDSLRSGEEKREHHNKSPYAQQLRQVLDVLQDEEPRKAVSTHHHDIMTHKDCSCADCQPSPHHPGIRTKHYHQEVYQPKRLTEQEYMTKHKPNTSPREPSNISPKPFQRINSDSMHGQPPYSGQCNGPCCISETSPGYKMREHVLHYADNEKTHYLDKSPPPGIRYVHSPEMIEPSKHGERHHGHHCSDKCSCRGPGVLNYVPFGFHQMSENPHGIHDLPPMSPSNRRKRPYIPLLPNEEPPHLKYTKVKRIDGSKLTAQKVLQDFTKRRFIPYNPRYDLSLLIVPPPIPAIEFLKGARHHAQQRNPSQKENYSPPTMNSKNKDALETDSKVDDRQEDRIQSPERTDQVLKIDAENSISDTNNNDTPLSNSNENEDSNTHSNNNNNNNNNNNSGKNKLFLPAHPYTPSKSVKVLPSIKEESRNKLEDHISKLRKEQVANSNFFMNSNDNNNNGPDSMLNQDHDISAMNMNVGRRTEQYCN